MAINSSTEVIGEMKETLIRTNKRLDQVQQYVEKVMRSSASWSDEQGQAYRSLMKEIGALAAAPQETLQGAVPKLDRLNEALEEYGRVRF